MKDFRVGICAAFFMVLVLLKKVEQRKLMNVDEVLRIIDCAQHNDLNGEVCPAGWDKEKEALRPTQEDTADYIASNKDEL